MSKQNEMEAVLNLLLRQIKQQPVKTDVQVPTWVEKRFGIPQSAEEILWRLAWLICIPAVATLLALPLLDWLWFNGFPWIVVLFAAFSGLIYWAFYFAAANTENSKALGKLVDIQFAIPPLTVWLILVWEVLSQGNGTRP